MKRGDTISCTVYVDLRTCSDVGCCGDAYSSERYEGMAFSERTPDA